MGLVDASTPMAGSSAGSLVRVHTNSCQWPVCRLAAQLNRPKHCFKYLSNALQQLLRAAGAAPMLQIPGTGCRRVPQQAAGLGWTGFLRAAGVCILCFLQAAPWVFCVPCKQLVWVSCVSCKQHCCHTSTARLNTRSTADTPTCAVACILL